ncbi:MAG: serpin family protein [Bacteroidetes bacterium]|nr:serpin family protein [Bacteroidota bacterium]
MKKFVLIVLPLLLFATCDKEQAVKEPKSFDVSAEQQQLINNGNAFSIKILQQINQAESSSKNLFFSPFSISMALGMTLNGAGGLTKEAMLQSLQLHDMSIDDINASYKYLIDNLKPLDPDVTFDIANSIWYRNDYTVLADFIKTNRDYFYAEISPLDFNKSELAKQIINDWVKDKTKGKIEEIVDQINPTSFMFLINALYFNANWMYQFDKSDTRDMNFHLIDGSSTSTPFMNQKMDIKSFSNHELHCIEMFYGEGNFSTVFILPQSNSSLDDVIDDFSLSKWNTYLSSMTEVQGMDIYIPKFNYAYDIELKEVLTAMGMGIAFGEHADFSGINTQLDLFISKIKHKAYIDVNEKGTEAAAVTSVEISFTSIAQFVANEPFLFLIKERNSGAILFIGKVMDPS